MRMQNSSDVLAGLTMDCLAFGSRRAARAVTNYFNGVLRPLDLSTAQFGLMIAIARKPDQTLREISQMLMLDESTLARNHAVLERRGLVESDGGRGRGGRRVRLAEAGWRQIEAGSALWRAANARLEAGLTVDELDAGKRFLDALARASDTLVEAQRNADEPVLLGDGVD